jgi:hypothetical protein
LPIETGSALSSPNSTPNDPVPRRRSERHPLTRRQLSEIALDLVERLPAGRLFGIWLALIVGCGALYWLAALTGHQVLTGDSSGVGAGLDGFWTAIYFSFATATSVGYGDVVPVGTGRILAVSEATGGLLIFGLLIAKFVSYRQDLLVRQIHSITFEERLDRLQTNLHLVVSELLAIGTAWADGSGQTPQIELRLESTALVLAAELRAIHRLLYEPQQGPEELLLDSILASLFAALNTIRDLLRRLPPAVQRTPALDNALKTISELAQEICADCVPRVYGPDLRVLMDHIQQTARMLI